MEILLTKKSATNSNISFPNGFASLFIKTEMGTLFVGFPYALSIILIALNEYCFVALVYSTVLLTLVTGFFQVIYMIITLLIHYIHHAKMQLNDVIKISVGIRNL